MKVFISRSIELYPTLEKRLHDQNHALIANSLIKTSQVEFNPESNAEWVFFSSSNAVHYYFAKASHSGKKHAAIGYATAQALSEYVEVNFQGSDRDMKKVGEAFAKCIGEAKVLFPISTRSLRTVQKCLRNEQVEELNVYQTDSNSNVIEPCDIYVFSSPSNVESFAEKNTFPPGCVVLVPGEKTRLAVEKITSVRIIDVHSLADSDVTDTIFSGLLS